MSLYELHSRLAQNNGKIYCQAHGGANMQPTSSINGTHSRSALLCLASVCLGGCSASGAPSFDLFGAFFPAWLLCGAVGIAGAAIARVAFVSSGLSNVLPYQLTLCTAIGVITAVLFWLVVFGR
jgi:YtcA family